MDARTVTPVIAALPEKISEFVDGILAEDVGCGDVTTRASIPDTCSGSAVVRAGEDGVAAGVSLAGSLFRRLDPAMSVEARIGDGQMLRAGDTILTLTGRVHAILKGERVALNCLQRMSGVATRTRRFVRMIEGTGCQLLDTRKTTPGFRLAEKWAVEIGGGHNHRHTLGEMILIKDNHIDLGGGIKKVLQSVHDFLEREKRDLKMAVEVRSIDELEQVLQADQSFGIVHRILFDNMSAVEINRGMHRIEDALETEATGGVNESTLLDIAKTGVNFISMGSLTTHYQSLEISMQAC